MLYIILKRNINILKGNKQTFLKIETLKFLRGQMKRQRIPPMIAPTTVPTGPNTLPIVAPCAINWSAGESFTIKSKCGELFCV